MKSKFIYIFVFLLFAVLGTYFAFATLTDVTLNAPADNANISGTYTYNASITGSNADNVTFYYWNTTDWVQVCFNGTPGTEFLCANDTNNIDDGTYTFNVTAKNDTTTVSNNNTGITVDNTEPYIAYNTSTLAAGANQSGNFLINITATDGGSGVKNISIFVNGSLVRSCSSSPCNWTNNSVDGSYIFNATAEDYATNKNVSIGSRTITIDTTNPTVSLSCSPISVSIGVSVTCTCTATDVTSGVNSSSYSYALSTSTSSSASQSTSSAGTFTETCTVSDYAGNSDSDTASYVVSGGGLPSGWTPPTTTYNIGTLKEAGVTKEVKVDEKVKFVSEEVEYVATIDEVTSTTAELTLADQTFTLSVGDEKKIDLDEDDVYEASVTLIGIAQSKAELTFKAISEAVPIEEEFEEELCGNGVVDGGENCENCPEDVKCAADEECKEGVCEKKEVAPPKAKLTWLWIALGALVVIGIIIYLTTKKKK